MKKTLLYFIVFSFLLHSVFAQESFNLEVEIKVPDGFQRALELRAATSELGVIDILRAMALTVERRTKVRAPIKTGRLKASYGTREEQNIQAGIFSITVGTDVHYAPHQEFGTKFQPGTPHLVPSFEETIRNFVVKTSKELSRLWANG